MGTPVGAHSASNKSLHLADGVQEKKALHEPSRLGGVLLRLGRSPAIDHGVQVETVEHRSVLDRLEPTERVRFPGAAFLGGGQVHLALEIAEVDEDAVFIDEAPPELGVGLGDGGFGVGMERFGREGKARNHARTEGEGGLEKGAAFHGAMGSISIGTRLRLSRK